MARAGSDAFDHMIKLLLVGEAGVGKSSILLRFTEDAFDDGQAATCAACCPCQAGPHGIVLMSQDGAVQVHGSGKLVAAPPQSCMRRRRSCLGNSSAAAHSQPLLTLTSDMHLPHTQYRGGLQGEDSDCRAQAGQG